MLLAQTMPGGFEVGPKAPQGLPSERQRGCHGGPHGLDLGGGSEHVHEAGTAGGLEGHGVA